MKSVRSASIRGVVLVLILVSAAPAQVGGPPAPPPTLWNFLGIPQGIRKLRGATANRRGNNPQKEPKPPLKAIADPVNLESPDPSIKKAAEVKQAEDLKKQKIKAVKYLAGIGCGCYDVDGGVTAALVASMGDCTEDVRYETINAIQEAADGESCSNCGQVCCCNKDILTQMATIAYERDDTGCYIEPSERVREAAAEALVTCCPNDSPPVIMEDEQPSPPPERESLEPSTADPERESGPPPIPGQPNPFEELPSGDSVTRAIPQAPTELPSRQQRDASIAPATDHSDSYGFGVVVHVSAAHRLAHVHFHNPALQAPAGSVIGIYEQVGERRKLLAKLTVVEAFAGSANVSGDADALSRIARGDIAVRPPVKRSAQSGVQLATDSPSRSVRLAQRHAQAGPTADASRPAGHVFQATSLDDSPARKVGGRGYRGFVR